MSRTGSGSQTAIDRGELSNMDHLVIEGDTARCDIALGGTCVYGEEVLHRPSGRVVGLAGPEWTRDRTADQHQVQNILDGYFLARTQGCSTCMVAQGHQVQLDREAEKRSGCRHRLRC